MLRLARPILPALCVACAACASGAAQIPAEAVRSDIADWRDWTLATHPDLSHSADPQRVAAAFDALSARLDGSYDARAAWREMATLNPLLNDAHLGVRLPDAAFAEARRGGAAAFPAPVRIEGDRLFVGETIRPESVLTPGAEISAINDQPAQDLLATILPRMRGESDGLRARIASLRFPVALWAAQGDAPSYRVTLAGTDEPLTLDAQRDRDANASAAPFDLGFRGNVAVLEIDTFDIEHLDAFSTFTAAAFAEISAREPAALVIDLRDNGGGARDLSNVLMHYLTPERFTPISGVTARITAQNQSLVPGSEIGQVIETPFAQWVEPPADLAHRYKGRAVILVGPDTYSQAIAFSVTAQDFNIAEIAGSPTDGSANQTGQVQRVTLENTGLEAQAPLYVFRRPSGAAGRAPLVPDLLVEGTGEAQLEAVIRLITP